MKNGIVHRDLKPVNKFLADGGWVKILDLGFGELRPEQAAAEGATASLGIAATNPGVVMGTITGARAPHQSSSSVT